MDVSLLIRQKLKEYGLEQKDLAAAAQVTDSYISQLLTRKKPPPAPGRTDIYERIGNFLRLPPGELAGLAAEQRKQELKRKVLDPPLPLRGDFRELILRKCEPVKRTEIRRIFEKEALGELERLVTRKILDAAQALVREQLNDEAGLRQAALARGWSYERMRVEALEFLDAGVPGISPENCASFLDPSIDSWDIDIDTFAMEITPNPRLSPGPKRFEFLEKAADPPPEPGFLAFLADPAMSAGAAPEELDFLGGLRFKSRRPSPLYYYRELQSLRDPLHFPSGERK